MLNQSDIVRYLSPVPPPPQHIVFSILHAYVFSKSRRGNLPSETLSKLLSIYRKLLVQRGSNPFPTESPIERAFEAMRIQLLSVNKRWIKGEGVNSFGSLGTIGATGGSPLAIEAWRKATDNKIKEFPISDPDEFPEYHGHCGGHEGGRPAPHMGTTVQLDAGRVIEPSFSDTADPTSWNDLESAPPPGYGDPPATEPPTTATTTAERTTREQDPQLVEAMQDRLNGETGRPTSLTASESGTLNRTSRSVGEGSVSPPPDGTNGGRNSIEAGVSELARLRALKEERERAEEERNRTLANGD
ncbi:uncharacterized protein JCM6883_004200 [Sporobolomyces salmoneus]|uniref:uncharacterized protein n=1 Tax=Sporobolomyces salmoneus TaxID=183962 RepID=UPI00316B5A19